MRRPSNRPLMTALSVCTSPLQQPALPRINFRHSIRLLSRIPSATSVSHDLSSPDNTISGPRKTSRIRFLLRRGLLTPVLVPASDHHLARTMERSNQSSIPRHRNKTHARFVREAPTDYDQTIQCRRGALKSECYELTTDHPRFSYGK
jgi:hypothetical protein